MASRRPLHLLRGRHRILAGCSAALLCAVLTVVGGGLEASAGPHQDPTFATVTTAPAVASGQSLPADATSGELGVGDDGTEASSTTVSSSSTPGSSSRLLSESRKIMAIVGGLILIAIVLTLLTIRYWRQTKPEPVPAARRAKTDSTRAQRRAEAEADAQEQESRRSRRAVAGADHAGADDDWEPRGTGEHERVVLDPRPTESGRHARPSRAGRAAALRRDTSSS